MRATGEAIVACWSDAIGSGDHAALYADWILEHLVWSKNSNTLF